MRRFPIVTSGAGRRLDELHRGRVATGLVADATGTVTAVFADGFPDPRVARWFMMTK